MVFTGQGGIQEEVAVRISGDGSDLMETLDAAEAGLLNLRNVVGGLSAVLAGAGVAGFAAATSAAAEYEEALVEIEKVTNPETAREMGRAIREMAAEMPIAQRELAAIAADAGRFGVEGPENIQRFTETVARMATATDLSATEAGEAFARLAQLTGTPITELENLGSAINELSNNYATSSSEIVDSMLRSSAALSQLGLSGEEMVGLSAALNAVSESSERAGTRLRRLAQELLDPRNAEDLSMALGMTSEEFLRMRDEAPLELMRTMIERFAEGGETADALRRTLETTSRQALAGLAQNIDGVNRALEMSESSYRDATSLQREYNAASETFNAELQRTRNRLFNVAETTGAALLPALTDLLEDINAGISAFQDWNEATDGAAGSAATLGSAIVGLGGTAVWFAGGPVGLLVGATAAIAAAFATDFAEIRTTVARSMEDVGEIIARTMELTTEKTATELGNQVSAWEWFELNTASILDRLATGVVDIIDLYATLAEAQVRLSRLAVRGVQGDVSAEEAASEIRDIAQLGNRLRRNVQERNRNLQTRVQRRERLASGELPRWLMSDPQAGIVPSFNEEAQAQTSDAADKMESASEVLLSASNQYLESSETLRQTVRQGGTFTPSAEMLGISENRFRQLSAGGAIQRPIPQTREDLEMWADRVSGELRPGDVGLSPRQFGLMLEGVPLNRQTGGGGGTTTGPGTSATQRMARTLPQTATTFQNAVQTFDHAVQRFAGAEITVDQQGFIEFVEGRVERTQRRQADRVRRATGGQ